VAAGGINYLPKFLVIDLGRSTCNFRKKRNRGWPDGQNMGGKGRTSSKVIAGGEIWWPFGSAANAALKKKAVASPRSALIAGRKALSLRKRRGVKRRDQEPG
jgi:hypothetical protein